MCQGYPFHIRSIHHPDSIRGTIEGRIPMTKVEIVAYIHSIANGIVTVTPQPTDANRKFIPLTMVDIVMLPDSPRKAYISMPDYLAFGMGFKDRHAEEKASAAAKAKEAIALMATDKAPMGGLTVTQAHKAQQANNVKSTDSVASNFLSRQAQLRRIREEEARVENAMGQVGDLGLRFEDEIGAFRF
jgi:hypothetical protein